MSDTSSSSEPWRTAIDRLADAHRSVAHAKAQLATAEEQAEVAEQIAGALYLQAEAAGVITPAIRDDLYWDRVLRSKHIAKALGVNYSEVYKHVQPRTYKQICPQCEAMTTVVVRSLAALDRLSAEQPKPCDACVERNRSERQAARRASAKPDNVDYSFTARRQLQRRFGHPPRRPPAG